MTISKHIRPDGREAWRVQLLVEGVRKSYGLHETYREAAVAEAAAKATSAASPRGSTVGALGQRFIEEHEAKHRGAGRYASIWRHYMAGSALARMELRKVRLEHVVKWRRGVERTEATRTVVTGPRGERTAKRHGLGRKVSRQTVAHAFHLLRSFFAWAIEEGRASADPTAAVRVPDKIDPPWTWLREHEIAAVIAAAPTLAKRTILAVAIYAGLRASEIWQLRWNAVRLDDRPEIVVAKSTDGGPTKTNRVRFVPLLEPARAALLAWRCEAPGVGEALVFPNASRKSHRTGYDAGWPEILAASGIRREEVSGERRLPHFHDLRHTCASHLVQGTWTPALDLYRVGSWLGHRSLASTTRYAHLAPDGLHSAIANVQTGHAHSPKRAAAASGSKPAQPRSIQSRARRDSNPEPPA